jgi:hypothetical protein
MSHEMQIWSCGGGTQSGAIASLIASGELPRPDHAFMTDTGREKSGTWPFVHDFIRPTIAKVGLELTIIKTSDFDDTGLFSKATHDVLLPGFTTISGSVGKLEAWCSGRWKRDVGERWMRSIGIQTATNWIGISTDELRRLRNQHRDWLKLRYPLIFDVRYTRLRCVERIRADGWTREIPHSACFMCANQQDDEWLDMQRNFPADFAAACAIEIEIQRSDPHFWLHPSCVPLSQVDFTAQSSMFADRGCTHRMFHMRLQSTYSIPCDCGAKVKGQYETLGGVA